MFLDQNGYDIDYESKLVYSWDPITDRNIADIIRQMTLSIHTRT